MPFYLERLDVRGGERVALPEEGTVSIGRSPKNTITLPSEDRCVSAIHAIVYVSAQRLLLQDMQSTNGTFVNGKQAHERALEAGDEVRLGRSGPRFRVVGGTDGVGVGADVCAGIDIDNNIDGGADGYIDNDVDSDVDNDAGIYTDGGIGAGEIDEPPVKKDGSRVKIAAAAAAAVVIILMIFGISAMFRKPADRPPPAKDFFTPPSIESSNALITEEDGDAPRAFIPPPLSQTAVSTVERINSVLARFGETDYRAPPEMVERVEHYIALNTGSRKRYVAATLRRGRRFFPMIRRIFSEKNVPLELAYVAMQESGFDTEAVSHAGAVGLWQFMPATARSYGLEVSSRVDERKDPEKSTYAAAAYFRHLIAIFGAKSSVMLSMAAYNAGESRIINALKRIDDPMRDRDFWYLYRMGWLAEETNEYIPQIIALIIISENLEEYGFDDY